MARHVVWIQQAEVQGGGADVSEDDLKAYVKKNLAGYKVPREVVFMGELPRNATGKVLKRDLLEQHENGGSST